MGRQHSGGPPEFISRGGALSRPALWTAECRGGRMVWKKNVKKKNQPARVGRAAFQPEIQHVIELFGVGNRSVTCSCFMLQHPVSCRSLANLSSPLLSSLRLSQTSFAPSCWERLREHRRGQNVFVGRETATCVSSGVKGKAGAAAVPALTHSPSLLRARRT